MAPGSDADEDSSADEGSNVNERFIWAIDKRMIEVEQLSKLYGTSPAIQDVTFTVEEGEILGFLGPNGAGKTTTMRILTGYLPATSGTARVAGFDVHDSSMAVRQRIGYLPETPPLYPEMTVEGFLHFVARIKGVVAGDRSERVNIAMTRCNLLEKRKILIRKLSKGFRQRVGIAQAIVHDPPVIILDEPTVGLDPRQIIDVRNLIKSLAGDHTIILSTHILPEVQMTCDRITIINRGQVVATNSPDELVSQLQGSTHYELDVAGAIAEAVPQIEALEFVETVTVASAASVDALSEDTTEDEKAAGERSPDEKVAGEKATEGNDAEGLEAVSESVGDEDVNAKDAGYKASEADESSKVSAVDEGHDEVHKSDGDGSDGDPNAPSTDDGVTDDSQFEDGGVSSKKAESSEPTVGSLGAEGRTRLSVRFHPGADGGPALARTAIAAGLELYEMRRSQVSLEDVFLDLTTTDPSLKSTVKSPRDSAKVDANVGTAEPKIFDDGVSEDNKAEGSTPEDSTPEDSDDSKPQEDS